MQAHCTVVKPLFHDERRPDSSLCHTGTSFKVTSNAPDGIILIFNFVTPKEKHRKKDTDLHFLVSLPGTECLHAEESKGILDSHS